MMTETAPDAAAPRATVTALTPSSRVVFDTRADAHAATIDVARTARRAISLFSNDLEPDLFNRADVAEIFKNLILTHKFARVRILVKTPLRCVREGHRLAELANRFSSFIEIRVASLDDQRRRDTFLVADQRAVICRADASRYEGIADTRSAAVALHYLEFFDTAWERAAPATELRRLYL